MARVECPFEDCDYVVPDAEPALRAVLLSGHLQTHQSVQIPSAKIEQVRRPTVTSSGTSEDWCYFLSRWEDYVGATKVVGTDKAIQLLECCDEQLRRDLTRNEGGTLKNKPIVEILAAMKALAVREENPNIERLTLQNMTQDREESVRAFGARLRGQASVCRYTKACRCGLIVDYSDESAVGALIKGLADSEVRKQLLGEPNKLMTMEQAMSFVEAKTAGIRSAARLDLPHLADAVGSNYRRQAKGSSRPQPQDKADKGETCHFCGEKGHGKYPQLPKRRECPAFGKTCGKCGKENHLKKVCKVNKLPHTEQESALFDNVCYIAPNNHTKGPTLDHHIYSQAGQEWIKCLAKGQHASTRRADYATLGYKLRPGYRTTLIEGMADTGCQSCLSGTSILRKLGLTEHDLIPVNLRMHAANKSPIKVLGAILLSLETKDGKKETKQMIYITTSVTQLFLSREACTDLGIINSSFPSSQLAQVANLQATMEVTSPNKRKCSCPTRAKPPPVPTHPPLPATEENRPKLEAHLRALYKASTFNVCEHQPLPLMSGPPLRLVIEEDATPTAHHNPIPIPLHWQDQVKQGLDRDVRLGVIEQVPIGTPTTWCHRMVVCPKKNGSLRRTIDFQALNRHAARETHHTQSPFHQARAVPKNTKKTLFDAWNGYHSVQLHPDDRHLTTFITPWGRYRYRTAPQGYIASGDGYTARYDAIVSHIQTKTKCIDDTLIWSKSIEDAYIQAAEWLTLCGENGITLNPDKFRFAEESIEFAGFEIGLETVKPSRKFTNAIKDFPTPKNLTDIRSWFGLVNQVAYAFSMTETMEPFRNLLKPSTKFEWTDAHDSAFDRSKQVIVEEINTGVQIYDKEKPTCLATDWSKDGVGFWLFQKHCRCPSKDIFCCQTGWKVTLVGSRFTHSAESRYAPIEGEALAVADALDKARHFVLGCKDLTIAVDHKPLLKIFSDRSLEDIHNARLRNLKEKTLKYRFRMIHIQGIKNKASDALSRHPSGERMPDKMPLEDDINSLMAIPSILMTGTPTETETLSQETEEEITGSCIAYLESAHPITWDRLKTATTSDQKMQTLLDTIEEGFPDKQALTPRDIREYHIHRENLYTIDRVVVYKDRLVIPECLRQNCLDSLHAAHQGVSMMTAKAESTIFWPGINKDIHTTRSGCLDCNRMAPSQAAMPPVQPDLPSHPFQSICSDFFHHAGNNYLVVVDRFSGWPIVERAHEGATGLINTLRKTFSTFGIPDDITTDGGPEFTASSTVRFLQDWGVSHRLSSVANPHANCRAEIGVKTVKRMITGNTSKGNLNTDSFQKAILQYRNTPDPITKLSPAFTVFGRTIKDLIPVLPGKYKPHLYWNNIMEKREVALERRHNTDKDRWMEHTRPLQPLQVGDLVRIQNQQGNHPTKWDKTGVVVEVKQFHQYVVRIHGSGRATLRNRKFLRKITTDQSKGQLQPEAVVPPGQPLPTTTPTLIHLPTQTHLPTKAPETQKQPPIPPVHSEIETQISTPDTAPRVEEPLKNTTACQQTPSTRQENQQKELEVKKSTSGRPKRERRPPKWLIDEI